ncbi:HEAT repeat domain-containing protein [Streptomyces sp. SDT5-1]|uniref:HEAT repeat domain-containing protein n=1 Tax=Streptomyces sp. SDT5-1 TaxID=3406418 RepID=UPI003FD5FB64
MTITEQDTETLRALEDADASVRLRAALAVGSAPRPAYVKTLVERCAVEPEFFVRDMLTWALTRHPVDLTLPAVVREVTAGKAQARSQALHTLSKLGEPAAWPVITRELLTDPDDEVARCAWRAAVVLVPDESERAALADVLATQLGRGGRETQLSLSRALLDLGDTAVPAVDRATRAADPDVRAHALATGRVLRDPDTRIGFAIEDAKRVVALDGAPGMDHGVC